MIKYSNKIIQKKWNWIDCYFNLKKKSKNGEEEILNLSPKAIFANVIFFFFS